MSISVDTRSLGSYMYFSDDNFTQSTLNVPATPFRWKLAALGACTMLAHFTHQ